MTGLLLFYLFLVGSRAFDLIAAGGLVPVALGVSLLFFPGLGVWIVWREWRFGRAIADLGAELAARGELPADTLPRLPSGRPDRSAADARFVTVRERVTAEPEAWPRWFELALAYDDAGDRKRARAAMRRAIDLHSLAGN